MKSKDNGSAFFDISEEDFPVSSAALAEFLKATLAKGALFRFQAKGFSMTPFIRDGDILVISPLQKASLGLGACAAFNNPRTGKLTVHRVVAKHKGMYLMKGDNVFCADGLVNKELVLGEVSSIQGKGLSRWICAGYARFLIAFFSRINLLTLAVKTGRRCRELWNRPR